MFVSQHKEFLTKKLISRPANLALHLALLSSWDSYESCGLLRPAPVTAGTKTTFYVSWG